MSDREKKAPPESSVPGVPAWMVTYSDTITLLMTFFVMLMSFSTLDKEQFSKVRGSLQGHLGVIGTDRFNMDGLMTRRNMESSRVFLDGYENAPEYEPMKYIQDDFRRQLKVVSHVAANILQYELTRDGFEIHVQAGMLFEPGSAVFRAHARDALGAVAAAIRHLPHRLRVRASGDMFFLRSRGFQSRQQLAVERAARVCDFLTGERNIDASRLHVAARIEPDSAVYEDSEAAKVTLVVLRPEAKGDL